MIYLIHFEHEYKGTRHYLGYTEAETVDARLERHRASRGARLLQVLNDNNINYDVVRTWPGDRRLERKLKKQKNARRFCPICNPKKYMNNKKEEIKCL